MATWTVDLGDFFPQVVEMLMLFKERLSFETQQNPYGPGEERGNRKIPRGQRRLDPAVSCVPKKVFFIEQPARSIWLVLKSSGLFAGKLKQVREATYKRLNIAPEDL